MAFLAIATDLFVGVAPLRLLSHLRLCLKKHPFSASEATLN